MALVATSALEPSIESASTPKTSYRTAGLWRRAGAGAIDLLLLLPVLALAGLVMCLLIGQPVPRLAELSPDLLLAGLLDGSAAGEALLGMGIVVTMLYFFLFHAARGQTPGKQLLGLMVLTVYGERPGVGRCLLRTFGSLLSVVPFSLGLLWVGFDREKRALHDWVAGTYVVLAQ